MLCIADNSNNLERRLFTRSRRYVYRQMLSYRVISGKEATGNRFVNDGDSGRAFAVWLCEAAPFQQGNSHSVKIFRTDGVERSVRAGARREGRLFQDAEIASTNAPEWNGTGHPRRPYARRRLYSS